MNSLMFHCLAFCAILAATASAPTLSSLYQRDKAELTNLLGSLKKSIDKLEVDIAEAEKREQEEPIVEAEKTEDETRATLDELRGNPDSLAAMLEERGKKGKKKGGKPRPEVNSEIDFDDVEVDDEGFGLQERGRPEVNQELEAHDFKMAERGRPEVNSELEENEKEVNAESRNTLRGLLRELLLLERTNTDDADDNHAH